MTGIEWLRSLAPETAAGLLIHSRWYRNPYHLLDLTLPQYELIYQTSDGQDFLFYNEAYDHQLAWLESEIVGYDEMVDGAKRAAADLRQRVTSGRDESDFGKFMRETMKGDGQT